MSFYVKNDPIKSEKLSKVDHVHNLGIYFIKDMTTHSVLIACLVISY